MYTFHKFFGGDYINRIKELRSEAGLLQKDLAEILKCNPTAISKYELGQLGLSEENICKLCEIFHCTADYLLCRSESKKPVLTDRQAALLDAYEKASPRDRKLIEEILAAYEEKKESAVS